MTASTTAAAESAAEGEPEVYQQEVSSIWRKAQKRHVVAKGPPSHAPKEWITICGWHFGRAGKAIPPLASHPMCAKCRKASVAGPLGSLVAP